MESEPFCNEFYYVFSLSLSSMKVSENSHCIIVVEVISIHLDFLFLKYVLPGRISSIVNCYSDQNRDAIVDLLSLVVLYSKSCRRWTHQ